MPKLLGALRSAILTVLCACAGMILMQASAHAAQPDHDGETQPAGPASLGLLVPKGPPDYAPVLDALHDAQARRFGPYEYTSGTIDGVPVVVSIAPMDGPLARSLAAQDMLHHYRIAAFLYAGTSGAHLGPDQMRIGDIVLGAANVNFGNFFMARDGRIVGNEFGHEETGSNGNPVFYREPRLLSHLACAARRVSLRTTLPGWLNPGYPRPRPEVFYYGVQGTSTMWLADQDFIAKLVDVFKVIDEDGDWYSNLAAYLHRIPFVEVSTISNSGAELENTPRGVPERPAGEDRTASVVAQRLSNAVLLDLIRHDGHYLLAGGFTLPIESPYPQQAYATPKEPGDLLELGGCADLR